MGHNAQDGLKKGPWTPEEDLVLYKFIQEHGEGRWRAVPSKTGLRRCGKSCRLRWLNYLSPKVKRGNISPDEEELIIRLHKLLGNRWSLIAGRIPGRTDNDIKNYWNTHLSKKSSNGFTSVKQHAPVVKAVASCNKPKSAYQDGHNVETVAYTENSTAIENLEGFMIGELSNSSIKNIPSLNYFPLMGIAGGEMGITASSTPNMPEYVFSYSDLYQDGSGLYSNSHCPLSFPVQSETYLTNQNSELLLSYQWWDSRFDIVSAFNNNTNTMDLDEYEYGNKHLCLN
ncbi:hypothetical protein SUGI_0123280 [Cryptomeria japonica]|uniref:transcription repressor MYB5 n=1 Tax=Cryptomeria japonica TaxID=3369 RepID=UPI002408D08B|nr:transcription repressor MYB5 [Cryptomeria japonica]GLJ10167.1 hypothetical protein SUGI_0123280 [Cryptomeria japonica]